MAAGMIGYVIGSVIGGFHPGGLEVSLTYMVSSFQILWWTFYSVNLLSYW